MNDLSRGQKMRLTDLTPQTTLEIGVRLAFGAGRACDASCFGVDAAGKLSDERYFVFYNQKESPEGALRAIGGKDGENERFALDLARLPATIDRLVFTAAIDGDGAMADLQQGEVRIATGGTDVARQVLRGTDFKAEKAVILLELYRKDGWRLAVVGQGFAGGLSALLAHFGGQEAAPAAAPAPTAAVPPTVAAPPPADAPQKVRLAKQVSLEKKMQAQAPALLSLAKKASVSLAKAGLADHQARVALCLDISASMGAFYDDGLVQKLAERILALGCRFDDDGAIDVFLFGENAHQAPALSVDEFRGYVDRVVEKYPLEGGTNYAKVMQIIRAAYFKDAKGGARDKPAPAAVPVYVMFVTDGDTVAKEKVEQQVRWSSYEPLFWQFLGIGKSRRDIKGSSLLGKLSAGDFGFLEKLDSLSGRLLDNAAFFSVSDLASVTDDELYAQLMVEYPGWLKQARARGLLA